jgi:hypothetical protein
MSRGLGKIEALLLGEIAITLGDFVPDDQDKSRSHKCILLNSLDLAKLLMPPRAVGEPLRPIPTATRKAVVRAMHSFCRKFPEFRLAGGTGRKPLFMYELGDWRSVSWAEASLRSRNPVPYASLIGVPWGRRTRLPEFGYKYGTRPLYSEVAGVLGARHYREQMRLEAQLSNIRPLRFSAVH